MFDKLHGCFDKLHWFLAKIIAPFITPIFAVLNYFVLVNLIENKPWLRNLFLTLSIIYFLVTLALACYLVYSNLAEK